MPKALLQSTSSGLYCPAGDFYIDPKRPVNRAVITHAHADHVRAGSRQYICTDGNLALLKHRLGHHAECTVFPYGQPFRLGMATVSFHPAGHILGSAQVRVEVNGEVWVITGDYKRDSDPTCQPFEVVTCDTLITEATFAIPVYRWQPASVIAQQIWEWWLSCRQRGRTAVLFCYALGKSQRVLAELSHYTDESVYLHESVDVLTSIYRNAGVNMLPTKALNRAKSAELRNALVIAPPGASRSEPLNRIDNFETGFASGWMRVKANRKFRSYDRGFILSDHADWPQLLQTIQDSQAKKVWVDHGRSDVLVRYLNETGLKAEAWG